MANKQTNYFKITVGAVAGETRTAPSEVDKEATVLLGKLREALVHYFGEEYVALWFYKNQRAKAMCFPEWMENGDVIYGCAKALVATVVYPEMDETDVHTLVTKRGEDRKEISFKIWFREALIRIIENKKKSAPVGGAAAAGGGGAVPKFGFRMPDIKCWASVVRGEVRETVVAKAVASCGGAVPCVAPPENCGAAAFWTPAPTAPILARNDSASVLETQAPAVAASAAVAAAGPKGLLNVEDMLGQDWANLVDEA